MHYPIEAAADTNQAIDLLEDKIYDHNSNQIGKYDGCFFSKIVKDKNEKLVAGIAGWTWAGACEITQLWVDGSVRKLGIGKRLLEAVELEAKNKGCLTILVKSYSFQAPHFYERQGYSIEHILEGFPEGHSYYTLVKRIG